MPQGPTQYSPTLYNFLKSQNQQATHFFIGINIKTNPTVYQQAYNNGDEIACHTWSHPWMSSLTNAQIVSELGWTLQLISDLSGGRIARYWRPPMGDSYVLSHPFRTVREAQTCDLHSDNRVRAIAQHVFGLQQVDWNQDTADWTIGENKITVAGIEAALTKFINLPKSPGLSTCHISFPPFLPHFNSLYLCVSPVILEHELYAGTVQAFIDMYPQMLAKGWVTKSIGQLFDEPYYQNAVDDNPASPVYEQNIIANATGTLSGLVPTGTAATPSSAVSNSLVAAASVSSTRPAAATTTTATKNSAYSRFALDGSFISMTALLLALVGTANYITLA